MTVQNSVAPPKLAVVLLSGLCVCGGCRSDAHVNREEQVSSALVQSANNSPAPTVAESSLPPCDKDYLTFARSLAATAPSLGPRDPIYEEVVRAVDDTEPARQGRLQRLNVMVWRLNDSESLLKAADGTLNYDFGVAHRNNEWHVHCWNGAVR